MLQDILSIGQEVDIKQLDRNGEPMEMGRVYVSQLVVLLTRYGQNCNTYGILSCTTHIGESYHLSLYQ